MLRNQETIKISSIFHVNLSRENFEKILRYLIFGGIIFIVIFPIIGDYGKLFFPLGRDIFFRITVEILFFLYLLLLVINRQYLLKPSLILIFLFLYLAASGLATAFSVQPQFSLWGNIFRGQGFFSQIHYFFFFLILAGFLKTWDQWKKIIISAILVSFPVSLITIAEFARGISKAQSTLNNSTFLGMYLLLLIFVTLASIFSSRNRNFRILLAMILIFQLAAIYLARSRGAYLGFFTGLTVFIFYILAQKLYYSKKYFIILIAIISLLALGMFYYFLNDYFDPLKNFLIKNEIPTEQTILMDPMRWEYWRAAFLGIKEKPVLGWGPENFTVAFDKYYRGTFDGQADWSQLFADKVHDVFLEVGVTTGLAGLFLYLGIWGSAFWLLLRRRDANTLMHANDANNLLRIGFLATFAAYLTANSFSIDTTTSLIYITLYFGLTNFLAKKCDTNIIINTNYTNKLKAALIAFAIIFFPFLIFVIKNYNIKAFAANLKLNQAEEYMQRGNLERGFQKYEEGLAVNDPAVSPHIRYRYGNVAISLAEQRKYFGSEQNLNEIERAIDLQEENMKKEWPHFARNWILAGTLSNFLLESGKPEYKEKADEYFKRAVEFSPSRATTWFEWLKTDIIAGRRKEAEDKIKKMESINQKFAEESKKIINELLK